MTPQSQEKCSPLDLGDAVVEKSFRQCFEKPRAVHIVFVFINHVTTYTGTVKLAMQPSENDWMAGQPSSACTAEASNLPQNHSSTKN